MPILASNFRANSLQGIVYVSGGYANIDLPIDAFALEGQKNFVVKLRRDSFNGPILSVSNTFTINDYTTIVGLAANISTVNEGNLVQFTLTTTNVVNYTNVIYSVFPVTANVTSADFVANTGYVTIVNNVGVFALQANADLSLMDENGEVFRAQIKDKNNTNVFVSSNITIGDVSRGINVLSFTESATTTAEGGTLTLTFTATNANNIILYYSTDGNATTSTFTGGNTGSFILNGFSNTVTLLPTGVPYGTTQNFTVKLRSDTPTGPVIATSNNLIILDASIVDIQATGGNVIESGGYRIHAFTTSANLVINRLGISPTYNQIDYLVVAGGGGGGGGSSFNSLGGGGAGAGGYISGNLTLSSTGIVPIVIGGGGASPGGNAFGVNGSNTTLSGGINLTAVGGGYGAADQLDGRPGGNGGSGGGSIYSQGAKGQGYPGQGFPGGVYGEPVRVGGSGGGAGGASPMQPPGQFGYNENGPGGIGKVFEGSPPAYGTPGPSPGRWFAGGGGGGDAPPSPGGVRTGGAGGGGAGSPTNPAVGATPGTTNTGGGGGGGNSSVPGGTGGSGIVIIRYQYAPSITVSNVLTTASSFNISSNIIFTVNAQNANLITLYYSTDGNVTASNFIGGNTGSFVANASGGIVRLQANTNIPLGEARSFSLQIRQDSTTGFISNVSSNVTIENPTAITATSTAGNVITDTNYITHVFTSPGTFTVTKVPAATANATLELLVVGGGGASMATGTNPQGTAGAGAGGFIARSNVATATTYTVIVGAGGNGPAPSGLHTARNSSFIGGSGSANVNYIARGGGFGGGSGVDRNGGSGGAADGNGGSPGSGYNFPGPDQQGYPAAVANNPGAGGAGAAGSGTTGGYGLAAPMSPSLGTSYGTPGPGPGRYFAGGGGDTGGAGGGGGTGVAGTVNTGGGAGRGAPGAGGSGIVIIRYPR